jgi:glycosyltransferase involved in cell wall biosynthesis
VLFFSAYPGYSGSHRMAMEVAVACRDAGHTVIAAAPSDMEFLQRAAAQGMATRVVQAPESLLQFGKTLLRRSRWGKLRVLATELIPYVLRLRGVLRRERIDVVYAAQERAVVQIGPAARLAGVPLVWHLQGGLRTEQRWVHRLAARLASRIVCCSHAVAGTAREALGADSRTPLRVIHYGIPDRPPPAAGGAGVEPAAAPAAGVSGATVAQPAAAEPVRVLFAGNVVPEKGVHHLIRAFERIAAGSDRPVRLGIAGPTLDEGYLRLVRSAIAELGLDAAVDVMGYREDLPDLIDGADVVVCPSIERETIRSEHGSWDVDWKEGFCLVALEGMRAGKPVVASDSYGLREVVVDGETGLRVPPGDVEALAAAIRELAADPERRALFGAAGRRRFERTFRLDHMKREFLAELERVAG